MDESLRRLWCAVLEQALEDAKSRSFKHKEEALEWFHSPSRGTGSFLWICSALDIDPGLIKKALPARQVIPLPSVRGQWENMAANLSAI